MLKDEGIDGLTHYTTTKATPSLYVDVAELTGRLTGIGVAEGVAEGDALPPPPPVVFCTTAETTWPTSEIVSKAFIRVKYTEWELKTYRQCLSRYRQAHSEARRRKSSASSLGQLALRNRRFPSCSTVTECKFFCGCECSRVGENAVTLKLPTIWEIASPPAPTTSWTMFPRLSTRKFRVLPFCVMDPNYTAVC